MRRLVVACVLAGCGFSGPSDVSRTTAQEETDANLAAQDAC
jgi:hypothetical protein